MKVLRCMQEVANIGTGAMLANAISFTSSMAR